MERSIVWIWIQCIRFCTSISSRHEARVEGDAKTYVSLGRLVQHASAWCECEGYWRRENDNVQSRRFERNSIDSSLRKDPILS